TRLLGQQAGRRVRRQQRPGDRDLERVPVRDLDATAERAVLANVERLADEGDGDAAAGAGEQATLRVPRIRSGLERACEHAEHRRADTSLDNDDVLDLGLAGHALGAFENGAVVVL